MPGEDVLATAEQGGAIPFHGPGVELGYKGDECSFDDIVRKYDLAKNNSALERLARIVRGADTCQHDLTPESRGLQAIADGFSAAYDDDHTQLAAEMPVHDTLYQWCQHQMGR